jgi:hypothetical protein
MPHRKISICDICGIEWDTLKETRCWWRNDRGGEFTVLPDGINGHKYKWEVLCYECRCYLANAIDKVNEQRKGINIK